MLTQKLNQFALIIKQIDHIQTHLIPFEEIDHLEAEIIALLEKQPANKRNRIQQQLQKPRFKLNKLRIIKKSQINLKTKKKQQQKKYQKRKQVISIESIVSDQSKIKQKQSLRNTAAKALIIISMTQQEVANINKAQLQKISQELQQNCEVQAQIAQLINEQGQKLEELQDKIQGTNFNVLQAKKQLDQGYQIKNKSRRLKVRAALTGFFGFLGAKFGGIFGAIGGIFVGSAASSAVNVVNKD